MLSPPPSPLAQLWEPDGKPPASGADLRCTDAFTKRLRSGEVLASEAVTVKLDLETSRAVRLRLKDALVSMEHGERPVKVALACSDRYGNGGATREQVDSALDKYPTVGFAPYTTGKRLEVLFERFEALDESGTRTAGEVTLLPGDELSTTFLLYVVGYVMPAEASGRALDTATIEIDLSVRTVSGKRLPGVNWTSPKIKLLRYMK